MSIDTKIAIIGGGIAGLALALNLKRRNIDCRVYETAPELKELGVGITLLPHATREIDALGLCPRSSRSRSRMSKAASSIASASSSTRSRAANSPAIPIPSSASIAAGCIWRSIKPRVAALGPDRIVTNRHCVAIEQDDSGVTIRLRETSTGKDAPSVDAEVAIGCDGINSAVRKQFYPDEKVAFAGINTWRGVTRRKPILTGRTYMRVGSIRTGKIVIYPIIDNVDGEETSSSIGWPRSRRDMSRRTTGTNPASSTISCRIYQDWKFDWLDVGELIHKADTILEYPMVDKDPIARWTFGRITFAGDAAHPMYPRGSNGAAQALIDARTLADLLGRQSDPAQRSPNTRYARRETDGQDRAHQPRAPAGFHQYPRRRADRRQALRRPREIHHAGRAEALATITNASPGLRSRMWASRDLVFSFRHGRACPGHPRVCPKTWMPGTRPGMTVFKNRFLLPPRHQPRGVAAVDGGEIAVGETEIDDPFRGFGRGAIGKIRSEQDLRAFDEPRQTHQRPGMRGLRRVVMEAFEMRERAAFDRRRPAAGARSKRSTRNGIVPPACEKIHWMSG